MRPWEWTACQRARWAAAALARYDVIQAFEALAMLGTHSPSGLDDLLKQYDDAIG